MIGLAVRAGQDIAGQKLGVDQQEFGDQRALPRRDRPQGSTGRGGQHRTPQQDAQADGHELQQAAALAAHHHGAQTCRAPPRRSGAGCRKVSICAQGVHEPDSGARAGPAPWLADEWMAWSALSVDDGPAQADLAIVEDDGLAGGDGPLRFCKAHLDA